MTSALERLRQQNCDFKGSLGYTVRREVEGVKEGEEEEGEWKRKKKKGKKEGRDRQTAMTA